MSGGDVNLSREIAGFLRWVRELKDEKARLEDRLKREVLRRQGLQLQLSLARSGRLGHRR